jgi:chemotaxis protein methyltransferase CheR
MGSESPTADSLAWNSAELTDRQFRVISCILYDRCGIKLTEGKEGLVKARLSKRLRHLGLGDFDQYLDHLESGTGSGELYTMIDALTTNKTSFFREDAHFHFLRDNILPAVRRQGGKMRIWSAACSSGEEPYSIALLLKNAWPDIQQYDVKILATDISTRMLEQAKEGIYRPDVVGDVPRPMLTRFFTAVGTPANREYRVNDDVRSLIRFARLNLIEDWPMRGTFNLIFCRNVMIYFDKETQQRLVRRFWQLLESGGYLFVGHSESLTTTSKDYRYVQPATYRKHLA